uniref:Uncharacterized protein n=1 Tax=Anguilla anguilla TaxID=7936 RepID=A0A0E9W0N3_ANGAN
MRIVTIYVMPANIMHRTGITEHVKLLA